MCGSSPARITIWCLRLMDRTPASQAGNMGSTPVGITKVFKWNCSSRVECGPGKPRDAGSSPASSTIQKKSEPDSDWIWVRILRLYAGYFLLTSNCLSPGGAVWFFPAFLFIRVLAFPVFTRYDVGNQITRRKTIMEYIKSSLSAGCFYGICTWNQMFEI